MRLVPRLLAAVTTLLLTATAVTGCAEAPAPAPTGGGTGAGQTLLDRAPVATPEELAKSPTASAIKNRGELLIGGDSNLPLLSQQNPTTGQTDGFDATLGQLLAKYIIGQPNSRIVNCTPETREALLQINTVDVVIRIYTITPKRAEKVSFAGPYLNSGQAIATLKTTTGISKPEDLNGKTVIAVAGATSIGAIEKAAPSAKIMTVGTAGEAVQALEQGKGVAYVHDLTLLAGIAQLNKKIQITGKPFTDEPYGIGLRHGDESFKAFVNNWLEKIEANGLWKQAWQESLGTVVAGDAPTPPAIASVPGT